jgi:hypothetical protein
MTINVDSIDVYNPGFITKAILIKINGIEFYFSKEMFAYLKYEVNRV